MGKQAQFTNGEGLSLLVPFRAADEQRAETWDWLHRYWRHELPAAEIIVGEDHGTPFSKSCAVNDAAARATGEIFVILDADCYMEGRRLGQYAFRASRAGRRWFMPYSMMWRITRPESARVLASDPTSPLRLEPPPPWDIVQGGEAAGEYAHRFKRYGALVQLMPAAAFREVGGMDPRFRGWGQEDGAFARALDTLWAYRTNGSGHAFHLWHARIGEGTGYAGRQWIGQETKQVNTELAARYIEAAGNPTVMRRLVRAGFEASDLEVGAPK